LSFVLTYEYTIKAQSRPIQVHLVPSTKLDV